MLRTPESAGAREEGSDRPLDVAVASIPSTRQRRPLLVLAGVLAVALAGLGGALAFGSLTTTASVLVAARDLEPGEVLTSADIRVIEISNFGEGATIGVGEQASIVDRVARGPIPAGTVLNIGLFGASGSVVPAGMSVVGAALEPGAAPGPNLRSGDRVDILGVSNGVSGLDRPDDAEAVVLASGAVWSVERPGGSVGGRIIVSLLVPADTRTAVAQAAADDRLRLALIAEE